MKPIHLSALALLLALSAAPLVHADDATAPAVGANYDGDILHMRFDDGEVTIKHYKAETSLGANSVEGGDKAGYDFKLSLDRKYLLNGDADAKESSAVLLVEPSLDLHLANEANASVPGGSPGTSPNRIELSAGGLGFLHGEERNLVPTLKDQAEADAANAHLKELMKASNDAAVDRDRLDSSDPAYATADKKFNEAQQARDQYINELKQKKNLIVNEGACSSENYGCVEAIKSMVSRTGEITVVKAKGVYNKNDLLGTQQAGAELDFGDASFDAAVRVNGVNLHVCGAVIPIAYIAGSSQGMGKSYSLLKACAGAKTRLGTIDYSATGKTDWNDFNGKDEYISGYASIEQRVDVKNILDSPVGVYASDLQEKSLQGSAHIRTVGIQGAF